MGNPAGTFNVDSAGVISTTAALNYEDKTSYTLYIQAIDSNGATGAKSSTAIVTINVGPVNEQAPVFNPSSYADNKDESLNIGESILQVIATDSDDGDDGVVYYSMATNNFFHLDTQTGDIFLKDQLDYETTKQHIFNIVAHDSSTTTAQSTTVTVTINVNDINEFAPICTPSLVTVSHSEALASLSAVASLTCNDHDNSTDATNLQYVVHKVNNIITAGDFTIDGTGVLKLIGGFDYETTTDYNILVQVYDNGLPNALTSTATIKVEITDVNEFTPAFNGPYNFTIPESTSSGSSIYKVEATDGDHGQTVTYSFQPQSSNFSIDQADGTIYLNEAIDYDVLVDKFFVLTVIVVDNGVTPDDKTGTASVIINISDLNDAVPYFQPAVYYTSVAENDQSNTPVNVTTVTAIDIDSTLTYSLADGFSIFTIDSTTGVISLAAASGDYETTKSYTLVANAVDSTPSTGTATVHVVITAVNEHSPTFNPGTAAVSINEEVALEQVIVTPTAIDLDDGPDGQLTFSLIGVPTEIQNLIAINPTTGALSVADIIDRENLTTAVFLLEITATDGGNTGKN